MPRARGPQEEKRVHPWMMDKQDVHPHSGIYYSAIKKKEILTHAMTWMNLEDIVLRGARHKRTDTVWFHSQEVPRGVTSIETGSRWWGPGVGGGDRESVFHGDSVSVWEDEKVLEMMVGMVARQCECAQCHRAVHLKMVKMVHFMVCLFYHKKKKESKPYPTCTWMAKI